MRAFHMPSMPSMPLKTSYNNVDVFQRMKLKILYTVDDNTTFLARSSEPSDVKTANIPIPGHNTMMTLGAVSLRDVLYILSNSSPELFSEDDDYSVYVKDVSEEDEPFVGHGLVSRLVKDNSFIADDELLVPGRVCSNFAALLSRKSEVSETLEVKVKLAKIRKSIHLQESQIRHKQQQQQQQQQHLPLRVHQSKQELQADKDSSNSNETEDENDFQVPKQIQPVKKVQPPRKTNFAPAPKAVRTQSLPSFEMIGSKKLNPADSIPSRFPPQSIAHQIYLADKNNLEKTQYSFHIKTIDEKDEPVDVNTDVTKRFASDFIKKNTKRSKKSYSVSPFTNRNTAQSSKPDPKSSQPQQSILEVQDNPTKSLPVCTNCQTTSSKSWRWNETEDESQRGLFCNACYTYLMDKGNMRPKYLFRRSRKASSKKETKSSSPATHTSSDPITSSTVPWNKKKDSTATDQIQQDLDQLMNSDYDLTFGPMTDIDPLPPQKATRLNTIQIDNKENIPPTPRPMVAKASNELRKATKQNSFEKMLEKSFTGGLPNIPNDFNSPSEWMTQLFNDTEPTPRDQDNFTPRDNETPNDITTCNTLPCVEEEPINSNSSKPMLSDEYATRHSTSQINVNDATHLNKLKATTMPSSPLALLQENETSSPNSINNTSEWNLLSENTKLSSVDTMHQK